MTLQKPNSDVKCKVDESGQTMVEFTVLVVMFLVVSAATVVLLTLFTEYGWRIISLLGMNL